MLKLSRYDDLGKLIVRLMVGVLILFHGVHKVLEPGVSRFHPQNAHILQPAFVAGLRSLSRRDCWSLDGYSGCLLAYGGLFIAGNMLFALGLAHRAQIFTLTSTGGWALELQAFFLLSGLAIIFLGSGRLALKPD